LAGFGKKEIAGIASSTFTSFAVIPRYLYLERGLDTYG
jgi:hypothetical protein